MGGLHRGLSVQLVPAPQPVAHLLRSVTGQVVERLQAWVSQNPPQSKEGPSPREEWMGRAGGPLSHCLTEDTACPASARGPWEGPDVVALGPRPLSLPQLAW